MPSVTIHPPKTPVHKGSRGVAAATTPNVCKMPGPPAPFVPTPLPNIARSGMSPQNYSKTVRIEGNPVAIRGATFASTGDIASKATGGGLLSANTHGPAKFITPGSLTVKMEGKSVHLLGEPMLNNCGPSGSPPNTGATLAGVVQGSAKPDSALVKAVGKADADALCNAACGAMKDKKKAKKTAKTQSLMRNRLDSESRGKSKGTSADMESGCLTEVGQQIKPGGGPFVGKWGTATSPGAGTKVKWDVILTNSKPAPSQGTLKWPGDVKKLIEVKFPGDSLTDNQSEMLNELGKNKDKVFVMDVERDCDCK